MVIAATGDDKANLVTSLLAKTEFGVPRTVGRVNHPNNEWLFTEAWGVDVNVSTPRIMSALVEEAVTVGDLVRLFTFRQGNANLVEMTLPADSPYVGKPSGLIPFPENCSLVTILRDGQVYTPDPDQPVEAGDELLFVVPAEIEEELEKMLAPTEHGGEREADRPSSPRPRMRLRPRRSVRSMLTVEESIVIDKPRDRGLRLLREPRQRRRLQQQPRRLRRRLGRTARGRTPGRSSRSRSSGSASSTPTSSSSTSRTSA